MQERVEVGRNDMLRWVVGSLISYPNGGGDIQVMEQIARIEAAARQAGAEEARAEIERRNSIAYARNVNAEYRARRAHAESQKKERGK